MTATLAQSVIPLTVRPYDASLHGEVVALITGIQQREFALPITYDDQFDLKDMEGTYRTGKGNFWVALQEGSVIGTIGLIDTDGRNAALKKMFVREECRGKTLSVAQHLLAVLQDWARKKGIKTLYLGTTDAFRAAQRFYARNGFAPIAETSLPPAIFETRAKVDTRHYYKAL